MNESQPLKGIIFDMDGTIADTLPVLFAAFRRAFQEHGGSWYSDSAIEGMFGQNEEGIIRNVLPDAHEAAYKTFLEEYERSHDLSPEPFAGVTDVLRDLRARDVRVAMVTGKGEGSAEISMRRLGIASYFEIIETGSAKTRIKAECIRRVVAQWGLPSEVVAYVGDAVTDVIDARDAGVVALSAAWASTADANALRAAKPDALFESMDKFAAFIEAHTEG